MRISSSWLTLGATLSLLIPAWTANAQEFTIPLSPYTKVVLEPDDKIKITSLTAPEVDTKAVDTKALEAPKTKPELVTNSQPALRDIQDAIASLPKSVVPYELNLSAPESAIIQNSQIAQPQKVSSSTEPARTIPSAAASNSGQLDPAQTLVVPTTPKQVKLDITKPVTLAEILELVERTNSDAIRSRIAVERARAALGSGRHHPGTVPTHPQQWTNPQRLSPAAGPISSSSNASATAPPARACRAPAGN